MSDNYLKKENSEIQEEEEISILDILIVLGEYKRFIVLFTIACTFLATFISLMLAPVYTAKTVFIPPQQQSSTASSLLSSIGNLAGISGGSGAPVKNSDELYIALIKSEYLLNQVIIKHRLKERYLTKTDADTRKYLIDKAKITSDKKSGLISIEVNDLDPHFAATLANSFVVELGKMTEKFALTEAQQKRLFFETEIVKTENKLKRAEDQFQEAQGKKGFHVTSINADTIFKNITELHGLIAAREIQLKAIERFATLKNTEVQKLTSELTAMRSTLQNLEQGTGNFPIESSQQNAMMAYRELKTQESMLEALVKQLEIARIDEAKDGPFIQVVDLAAPPEIRSSPKRGLIVTSSFVIALLFSLFVVYVRKSLKSIVIEAEKKNKVSKFKSAWNLSN